MLCFTRKYVESVIAALCIMLTARIYVVMTDDGGRKCLHSEKGMYLLTEERKYPQGAVISLFAVKCSQ